MAIEKQKRSWLKFRELRMKRLVDYVSPISWFCVYVAGITPLIFILEPSIKEFVIVLLVDSVAYAIVSPLSWKIFQRFYPETRMYMDGLSDSSVLAMNRSDRVQMIESIMQYPKRMARYTAVTSLIKLIPAWLIIVFYWEHAISSLAQFALVVACSLSTIVYFYGATFLEAHIFLSRELARLHEQFDFADSFRECAIVGSKRDFVFQEGLTLGYIIVVSMVLQALVIFVHHTDPFSTYGGKLLLVGAISLLLFGRIWYLSTRFSHSSLDQVIARLSDVQPKSNQPVLALSSAPHYAQFFRTFNETTERLRTVERELSLLVFRESDRSRFRALGEISALVAHDLSGPLHVTRYCAQELNEQMANHPVYGKYIQMILTNTERANDLILALRARLRNESSSTIGSGFVEAHHHTLNVLKTQFSKLDFDRVRITLDPGVENLILGVSRVDLIHILDNLYKNSLRNMIDAQVSDPELRISFLDGALLIQDNGTGLSRERFESLTAFQFETQGEIRVGLGLRLIRRLIEVGGGSLNVLDPSLMGRDTGTVMSLRLKVMEAGITERPHVAPRLREDVHASV